MTSKQRTHSCGSKTPESNQTSFNLIHNKNQAKIIIDQVPFVCILSILFHIDTCFFFISTSNARLRTRSALSHRNHAFQLSANY